MTDPATAWFTVALAFLAALAVLALAIDYGDGPK